MLAKVAVEDAGVAAAVLLLAKDSSSVSCSVISVRPDSWVDVRWSATSRHLS